MYLFVNVAFLLISPLGAMPSGGVGSWSLAERPLEGSNWSSARSRSRAASRARLRGKRREIEWIGVRDLTTKR